LIRFDRSSMCQCLTIPLSREDSFKPQMNTDKHR
jgi:hypothetical protein